MFSKWHVLDKEVLGNTVPAQSDRDQYLRFRFLVNGVYGTPAQETSKGTRQRSQEYEKTEGLVMAHAMFSTTTRI